MSHRLTAIILLCLPLAAAAEVYQYRDAQGRTVYSDTPPPGVNATKKDLNVTRQSEEATRALDEKMQGFEKRREEAASNEAKQAKEKAERALAAENCTKARNKLAALQSGQRIVRYNAAGEREFVDDASRAAETAQAQSSVAEWCK